MLKNSKKQSKFRETAQNYVNYKLTAKNFKKSSQKSKNCDITVKNVEKL